MKELVTCGQRGLDECSGADSMLKSSRLDAYGSVFLLLWLTEGCSCTDYYKMNMDEGKQKLINMSYHH